MTIKHVAVEIDITDQNTDNDTSQGLYAGFFRWVSDRPDYDGSTVVPTGDNAGNTWKEGLLNYKNSFGTPDRLIDINLGGDYASLSGFSFNRDNSVKFQSYLDTNEYYIINRPISFYIILDNVFYQRWTGIISDIKFNETTYEIICEDIFESEHPAIPPTTLNETNSPNIISSESGKNIPVVFGDVLRSPILTNQSKSQKVTMGFSDYHNKELTITTAYSAFLTSDSDGNEVWSLILRTPNIFFGENHFLTSGKYWLKTIIGEEQNILITGNDETSGASAKNWTTTIFLSKPFETVSTVSDFSTNNSYPSGGSVVSSDVWFFEIISMERTYIVSEKAVSSFIEDDSKLFGLVKFDDDKDDYVSIPELISDTDISISNNLSHPNISLINNNIDFEGEFTRVVSIEPELIREGAGPVDPSFIDYFSGEDLTLLTDKDRTTSITVLNNLTPPYAVAIVSIRITFPEKKLIEGFDELYICPDFTVETGVDAGGLNSNFSIRITGISAYGDSFETSFNTNPEDFIASTTRNYNFLPNDYYKNGNDNGENSIFGAVVSNTTNINSLIKVPATLVNNFNDSLAVSEFQVDFIFNGLGGDDNYESIKFKQLSFYGTKTLNLKQEPIYIQTKGELQSSNQTDNVYRAFQHILLDYDGFSSIEAGNLATERNTWPVGRTITEKKVSSQYLKELCLTSFVSITSNRYGKRTLSAFREDDTVVFTHTDANNAILNNTITSFEKSDISDVYNEFDLKYDFNPATGKYNRNIFITKVGVGASFPAIDTSTGTDTVRTFDSVKIESYTIGGDHVATIKFLADPTWATVGDKVSYASDIPASFEFATIQTVSTTQIIVVFVNTLGALMGNSSINGAVESHSEIFPLWTTYVGGINDFVTAKAYWDACQASFVRTNTVNKYPENLSKLNWYHDPGAFIGESPSFDSGAHRFVALLVPWATRQKDIARYSIPLTAANMTLELMNFGNFSDTIYTDSVTREGYITKMKDMADRIDLEVTLVPADITEVFADIIVETGSAPDLIVESGSQPDLIVEGP